MNWTRQRYIGLAGVCALAAALTACRAPREEKYSPPQRALDLNNRAVRAMSLGNHEEALKQIDDALALAPEFAKAYANKAAILNALDREEEAIEALTAALEIEPGFTEARIDLGMCLERANRRDEADRHYREALNQLNVAAASAPDDKELAVRRAITLYLAGEPATALREMRRLLGAYPDDPLVTAAKHRIEQGSRQDLLDSFNGQP